MVLKFLFKFIGTSRGKRMKLSASIERHGPHCKIAANFHFNPPKLLLVLFRKRMKGGNEVFKRSTREEVGIGSFVLLVLWLL